MEKTNENKTRNAAWEQYKLDKRYKFLTGIYLSTIAIGLIFLLVFANTSQGVQQILVAIIVMLVLVALDAFKQCMGDFESNPSNVFISEYIINDRRTYNDRTNVERYHRDLDHNYANTAAEIQQIVNDVEKSYLSHLPIETVAFLEESDKKKVIAEKVLEQIEGNYILKQKILTATRFGSFEALQELLGNPLAKMLIAGMKNWKEIDSIDSTARPSKLSQNADCE